VNLGEIDGDALPARSPGGHRSDIDELNSALVRPAGGPETAKASNPIANRAPRKQSGRRVRRYPREPWIDSAVADLDG